MFGGIESNRALLLSLLSCALAQASKVVTHWYDAPDVDVTAPLSDRPVTSHAIQRKGVDGYYGKGIETEGADG